ncbi:AAC(3) family N-acetyltransferase [Ferrovibrio terrae]|uniref:AAC(3) family N-acetyltransferase n=1 Tax=Ferrovibrio terrae TaxID=2594003 RepID=UPI003137F27B
MPDNQSVSTATKDLLSAITLLAGKSDRPIVVFSAVWPIARALKMTIEATTDLLLDHLVSIARNRTLLLPTFSNGYKDGFLDLDTTPSTTGILSEKFRTQQGSLRTASAFFSFSAIGPGSSELAELQPSEAWGDGSSYHWMEEQNALQLMIGAHPTHCSYLHRVEWLHRASIPYRYNKTFSGTIRLRGHTTTLQETLFVRSLSPEARNDFTVLHQPLLANGMSSLRIGPTVITAMSTLDMHDATSALLRSDPLYCLSNRRDFET